jgi:PilZ domain
MANKERRLSPRKDCVVQLRFRIASNEFEINRRSVDTTDTTRDVAVRTPAYLGTLEGESVNLSERGIYFRSHERLSIGEPIEMYFTIPRELTGRYMEHVRCSARVVHVEPAVDAQGMIGTGAAVERFEPMSAAHDWGN